MLGPNAATHPLLTSSPSSLAGARAVRSRPVVAGRVARRRPAVRRVVLLPPDRLHRAVAVRARPDLRAGGRPAHPDVGGRARRRAGRHRRRPDEPAGPGLPRRARLRAQPGLLGPGAGLVGAGRGVAAAGPLFRRHAGRLRGGPRRPGRRRPGAGPRSRQPRRRGRRPHRAAAPGRIGGVGVVLAGPVHRLRDRGVRVRGACWPLRTSRVRSPRPNRPPRCPTSARASAIGECGCWRWSRSSSTRSTSRSSGSPSPSWRSSAGSRTRRRPGRRERARRRRPRCRCARARRRRSAGPAAGSVARRPDRRAGRFGARHRGGARHPVPGALRSGRGRVQRAVLDHGAGPHPRSAPGPAGDDGGGDRLPLPAQRALAARRRARSPTGSDSPPRSGSTWSPRPRRPLRPRRSGAIRTALSR